MTDGFVQDFLYDQRDLAIHLMLDAISIQSDEIFVNATEIYEAFNRSLTARTYFEYENAIIHLARLFDFDTDQLQSLLCMFDDQTEEEFLSLFMD